MSKNWHANPLYSLHEKSFIARSMYLEELSNLTFVRRPGSLNKNDYLLCQRTLQYGYWNLEFTAKVHSCRALLLLFSLR